MRRFIQDKGRTEKPQVWEIFRKGNEVTSRWGQLGGAMQETTQYFQYVNQGKANEKKPPEVAQEWMERQILLRTRKGYVEVDLKTNKPLVEASSSEIDFIAPPENLRFFKPQNSINAHCEKLLERGRAEVDRKRDGLMHVVSIDEHGKARMFSLTMAANHKDEDAGTPWLERYPHLKLELEALQFPPNTILLGELCTGVASGHVDEYGMPVDDFTYTSSVVKSLTPRALDLQAEKGWLSYCIWYIAFHAGNNMMLESSGRKFGLLLDYLDNNPVRKYVTMPEWVLFEDDTSGVKMTLQSIEAPGFEIARVGTVTNDLLDIAKHMKWEGYVVSDPEARYEDRGFNFHGKPERPKGVCKLKPKLEADFIVRWDPDNGIGQRGKGKKSKGVGSVMAYLWDPDEQKEVEICEVGGGLSDDDVARLADPSLYPMVWKVEFDSWTPKGALRFPVFVEIREDKDLEGCTLDQRPALGAEEAEP